MTRPTTLIALATATAALAACHGDRPRPGAPLPNGARATAVLHDASGAEVGHANAVEVGGGLRVTLDVRGLTPGQHGAHIHTVGLCDAPGFTTAGGHWNPTARQHGSMNPAGPHEGDLPNLVVGADGRGTLGAVIPGASVAGMLDADGAAMIVHAGADDLMTDPAGNSGGRVVCGVWTKS